MHIIDQSLYEQQIEDEEFKMKKRSINQKQILSQVKNEYGGPVNLCNTPEDILVQKKGLGI